LLLVSHDRTFLDNVVTSTLVFEGDGKFGEYAGGYEDWERYQRQIPEAPVEPKKKPEGAQPKPALAAAQGRSRPRKLTYREQLELEALPQRIEVLEAKQSALVAEMAEGDFYKQARERITATMERLELLRQELENCYERWQFLESIATAVNE
jgi:ATP-binding cassette subfamily F protein uup